MVKKGNYRPIVMKGYIAVFVSMVTTKKSIWIWYPLSEAFLVALERFVNHHKLKILSEWWTAFGVLKWLFCKLAHLPVKKTINFSYSVLLLLQVWIRNRRFRLVVRLCLKFGSILIFTGNVQSPLTWQFLLRKFSDCTRLLRLRFDCCAKQHNMHTWVIIYCAFFTPLDLPLDPFLS